MIFSLNYDIIMIDRRSITLKEAFSLTYLGWVWIGVLIFSVIIEFLTDQFVSIWFAPAAVLSVILDFCGVGEVWQVLVFLVVSLAGILLLRRFLVKTSHISRTKTNIEAIVGSKCVVTEKIDNYAGCGQAKVGGQIWSARSADEDDVIEVGEVVNIVAIEGVKLICKKI